LKQKPDKKSETFETKNVLHFLSVFQILFKTKNAKHFLSGFCQVRSVFLLDFCSKFITK